MVSQAERQAAGRQFLVLITGHLRSTLSTESGERRVGRRTNICGVVVMWGLNRWDWAAALQGDENNRSNGTVFVKTA